MILMHLVMVHYLVGLCVQDFYDLMDHYSSRACISRVWLDAWSKDICELLPTSCYMALQRCYGLDWIACRSKANAFG